jgi:hypothetical protein
MVKIENLVLGKQYYGYYISDMKNSNGIYRHFQRIECIKILPPKFNNQARFRVIENYMNTGSSNSIGDSVPYFLKEVYEIDGNNKRTFTNIIRWVFKGKWLKIL